MQPTNSAEEKLIWDEWKRITRFLESSRIAFDRENLLWASLEAKDKKGVSLVTKEGPSTYSVELNDHLKAIRTHDVLFSLVLGATYALAESYGRLKLGLSDDDDLSGGIEAWGKKLLAAAGHDWAKVLGGLAGMVEVSVVRNAYAHGIRTANQKMINRFTAHGLSCPWSPGDEISLTYDSVEQYRARIKSLLRLGSNKKRSLALPSSKPRSAAAHVKQ